MKITADTNVLVRALTEDDAEQSKVAQLALPQGRYGRAHDTYALRVGLGAATL